MGSAPLKMLGALVWALLLVQTLATSVRQHPRERLKAAAAAAASWPPNSPLFELDDLGFDLEEKVGGVSARPKKRPPPSVMTSTHMNPFAEAEPGLADDSESLALCQIRLDELEVRVEDLEEQQAKMALGPALKAPGHLKLQPDSANAKQAGAEFPGMRTAGPIPALEIPNKMAGLGSMPNGRPNEERRENPAKRFGQEREQGKIDFGLPNRPTKRRTAKKSAKKRPAKKKSAKRRPAKKKSMKKRRRAKKSPAKKKSMKKRRRTKKSKKRPAKKANKKRPTKKRSMKDRRAKKNIREKGARKKRRPSKRYRKDRPSRLDVGRPTNFGRFSPEPINYLASLPGLKRPFRGGRPWRQHGARHDRQRRREERDRRRRRRDGRRERRRNRDRKRTRNFDKADDKDLTSSADSVSVEEFAEDAADDSQPMEDSDSDEDLGDEEEETDVDAEEEDMAETVDFDEDEITDGNLTEDDLTEESPATAEEEYESNENNLEVYSSYGSDGSYDMPGLSYDSYGSSLYPY